MITEFGRMTVLVDDYDDALDFYVGKLGFDVLWDGDLPDGTRTVHVGVQGRDDEETKVGSAGIWLLRAIDGEALDRVGNQTAGHPCFVLYADDCRGTYETLRGRGVEFHGTPEEGPTGVSVRFEDCCGNRGVLVELTGNA